MIFDWTVNLGNLISILTLGTGVLFFMSSIKYKVDYMEESIEDLKKSQKELSNHMLKLSQIITTVAVQDSRLEVLERAVDELRHGSGFILPLRTRTKKQIING